MASLVVSQRQPNQSGSHRPNVRRILYVISGSDMAAICDYCLRMPSDSTPLIQQLHITVGHVICGLVEERLFSRSA